MDENKVFSLDNVVVIATSAAQIPRLFGVILYIKWFLKDTV
jgi:hypothetical protein